MEKIHGVHKVSLQFLKNLQKHWPASVVMKDIGIGAQGRIKLFVGLGLYSC